MTPEALEDRTREIGREVFARANAAGASILSANWWDQRAMALSMRDPAVKVQLFRLVDTLPALKSNREVTRHLKEYFETVKGRVPRVVGRATEWIPERGWVGDVVAKAARFNATRMARRFIAGTDVEETLKTIEKLRDEGMGFTIDLLGEAILSDAEAREYQRQYLTFIDGLTKRAAGWKEHPVVDRGVGGKRVPPVNISVKLSSLYSQFDPIDPEATSRAVRERLRPIMELAKLRGAFVNVDMEQFAFKDMTIRIFQEILEEAEFKEWGDVGIAIQAYLKSAGEDLKGLADWVKRRGTPVWVRLVKGAYWDYETVIAAQQNWAVPVWERKAETDANFEEQTRFILENHELLRPAIGSHNVRSIAHAIALEEELGLERGTVEFQMLYGMADEIKAALVGMGRRVRVYTPFGKLLPGMAYLVRRLLENTSNQSFLRAGFIERVAVEELLMNPKSRMGKVGAERLGGNGQAQKAAAVAFRNEPLTDFSVGKNREEMAAAVREVAGKIPLASVVPMVIGGERKTAEKSFEVVNPSHSGRVIGRVSAASADDARRAVEAAERAFPGWRDTPVEERAGLLRRAAGVLRRRRFELAAWEVYECGKQWREADADIAEAIDFCEYYAREMIRLSKPLARNVAGEDNVYFYDALGPAVVIAPWNFPLAILCGMTAAALVTGNPAIMKPAEQSSVVASKLMEVFEEAGVPAGVLQYVPGVGEEIGPVLVGHPDVAVIAFTGSRAVGLAINKLASETPGDQIKRVITELGGKNASIIDDDADLDEAVHGVVAGAFGYAGQKCSACSRAIVLEGVYEQFLERLVEATRSLKVGPAEEPGTFVGPVIDRDARDRILKMIEKGKGEARLVYAAELGSLAGEGWYVGPHIFADVPAGASIAQDEIFGPVLAVIKAKDLTEAISIANGTRYALTGGLHSRSPANIERVRREFRVGNLYINRKITGALVDRQPFGGFKLSGTGPKAGGPDYLVQFMHARVVTENTLRHGFAPGNEGMVEGAGVGE